VHSLDPHTYKNAFTFRKFHALAFTKLIQRLGKIDIARKTIYKRKRKTKKEK